MIISCLILAALVYFLFHNIAFKNIFKRFKQHSRQKYGFYECGFRPKTESTPQLPMHTYLILSLAILYDVEGFFLLVFLINYTTIGVLDLIFILFYVFLIFWSFFFESALSGTS